MLCAFFLYACYSQVTAPWEVKYTGELRTVVTTDQVITMFVLQALAAAAVGYGMLIDLPKQGQPRTTHAGAHNTCSTNATAATCCLSFCPGCGCCTAAAM